MAVFYPFLDAESGSFPEQKSEDYRIATYVGAIGSDQIVPGPVFDTDQINDVHEVLTLLGLKLDALQPIRGNSGDANRFGWIDFEPALEITEGIILALGASEAGAFLLDLRTAVEMMKLIRPHDQGGCMIQVNPPKAA